MTPDLYKQELVDGCAGGRLAISLQKPTRTSQTWNLAAEIQIATRI